MIKNRRDRRRESASNGGEEPASRRGWIGERPCMAVKGTGMETAMCGVEGTGAESVNAVPVLWPLSGLYVA